MSKCLPILDKMPPEIMGKIFGYTDNMDKFRLRQCCKYFKQIVDDSEIVFDHLEFFWNDFSKYANVYDHHQINKTFKDTNPEKLVENGMLALKFLEKVLKSHPKIRLVKFEINVPFATKKLKEHREMVIEEVWRIFSGLENKLPVEILTMESIRDEQLLVSVLPHLVPGTLRQLSITSLTGRRIRIDLSRTIETEQLKQAEALITGNYLSIDLEKTDHFKYMKYSVARLEVADVQRIVENILRENGWKTRSIHENGWKQRFIYTDEDEYDSDAIKQYLLQFDHKILQNNDATLNMTIRRDGYGCEIEMDRRLRQMTFERIDSVS